MAWWSTHSDSVPLANVRCAMPYADPIESARVRPMQMQLPTAYSRQGMQVGSGVCSRAVRYTLLHTLHPTVDHSLRDRPTCEVRVLQRFRRGYPAGRSIVFQLRATLWHEWAATEADRTAEQSNPPPREV